MAQSTCEYSRGKCIDWSFALVLTLEKRTWCHPYETGKSSFACKYLDSVPIHVTIERLGVVHAKIAVLALSKAINCCEIWEGTLLYI